MVRLINPETGSLVKEFAPVTVKTRRWPRTRGTAVPPKQEEAVETEMLPKGASLASLEVLPGEIRLSNRFAYVQLLVTGKLATGEMLDVTRMVETSRVGWHRGGVALGSDPTQGRRQRDARRAGGQDRHGAGDRLWA